MEQCNKHTAFSYALIEVYQQRLDNYDDNTHFDGDASLLLGGLTVWGNRSVQHHRKSAYTVANIDKGGADTARSLGAVDDTAWQSIPQEPGSFFMGSFNAAHRRVAHAEKEPSEGPGVHITVTLRTDVFHTGQSGTEQVTTTEYIYDAFLRYQLSAVVARFVANRPPRIPTLRGAIDSIVCSFGNTYVV